MSQETVTLLAALIAALGSLYAVILAGSRNVASFRVKWIEDVRLALSEYVSLSLVHKGDADYNSAVQRMAEKDAYIRLALNPKEHESFVIVLTDVSSQLLDYDNINPQRVEARVNDLMNEAQALFRKEWKKAKREMRWLPW